MVNQTAPRLAGDHYQHLFAWYLALELKLPTKKVACVTIEAADAGSFDDVTVEHLEGSSLPAVFYQIKYHVDQREAYSTEVLKKTATGQSLLQKAFNSWKQLKNRKPDRPIELYLVSNWTWDPHDAIKSCISGHDNALSEKFFSAPPRSKIGKLRTDWQQHLNASDEEFHDFAGSLHFKLGCPSTSDLEKMICERMMHLKLKHDHPSALYTVIGIVRHSIMTEGEWRLTPEIIEEILRQHDLYLPVENEPAVAIYLTTIEEQQFDIPPDYRLDWRNLFEGDGNKKGHKIRDASDWNGRILADLLNLKQTINTSTTCRLIKVRGLSRLSVWFAFGFVFSEVARYTLEMDQQGSLWRTDVKPADDFKLMISSKGGLEGEILADSGNTVAVGISVTGSLDDDVRHYLRDSVACRETATALLLLRPERLLGRDCLRNAQDAAALAAAAKDHMRAFVKRRGATRLLLFYWGPLASAAFISHRLNALCREIQIMEDQQPGYTPSVLLT